MAIITNWIIDKIHELEMFNKKLTSISLNPETIKKLSSYSNLNNSNNNIDSIIGIPIISDPSIPINACEFNRKESIISPGSSINPISSTTEKIFIQCHNIEDPLRWVQDLINSSKINLRSQEPYLRKTKEEIVEIDKEKWNNFHELVNNDNLEKEKMDERIKVVSTISHMDYNDPLYKQIVNLLTYNSMI
jgi:hypothetical protein